MLISELIVRHLGHDGALHVRGIQLDPDQVPSGVRALQEGDDDVAPVAGDLLLVRAPVGSGLREHLDTDLPVGVTVALLLEVEVAELPVGRVLAALTVASLQVVEAAVVTGAASAMVAVVATRTDELVAPAPYLAHDLEPGSNQSPAVLRRVLGEHALEGLVQRARERALMAQVAEAEARVKEVTTEREQLRADWRARESALVGDLDTSRRERDAAREEVEIERRQIRLLRSSTSFRLASRLARAWSVPKRVIRRPPGGKARL